jgi:TPR repeat
MKPYKSFFVLISLLSTTSVTPVTAETNAPHSYEEARKASWILTTMFIEKLEEGDAKQWPGTHAWLKDLREQTKGISEDTPIARWPKVDIGALIDHNPNFWRMYFELAPGDPSFTLIYASLLLSQGEARRAEYILELGKHRSGIPEGTMQGLDMLQNTATAASDAVTEQGTKLFDQGDYDGAINKYREAQTLCPTNGWTHYEMGLTVATKAQVARGEAPDKLGTVKVNVESNYTPDVMAAFAEARRHDPLQLMAYQGSDPEVIKGYMAIVNQVVPAAKALRKEGITKVEEYDAIQDISEGLSEAGVHDLAIFARQLMVSHRNSYDSTDYPIIAAGLRKLAPGSAIEEILTRLAGKEPLGFRSLTKLENEDGQPALGSGERVYIPDSPPSEPDASKRVNVD